MNWGNIKWLLDQMTPEQLNAPAFVYNQYFGRLYKIEAIDHLENLSATKTNINPIVVSHSIEPTE